MLQQRNIGNIPQQMNLQNINKLIYCFILTVVFMTCTDVARIIQNVIIPTKLGDWWVFLNYCVGPFGLLFIAYLLKVFLFRSLLFMSSLGSIFYISVVYLINNFQMFNSNYQIGLVTAFALIACPIQTIFYCVLNYYTDRCAAPQNKGIYFGISYSIYFMQSLFSAFLGMYIQNNVDKENYTEGHGINVSLIVTICLSFTVSLFYWLVKEPCKINSNQTVDRNNLGNKNFKQNRNSDTSKTPSNKQQRKFSFINSFKGFIDIFRLEQISLLIVNMLLIGGLQVIHKYYGQRPFKINRKDLIDQIYYYQLYNGVGEFLGGITAGLASDLYSRTGTIKLIYYIFYCSTIISAIANYKQIDYIVIIYFLLTGLGTSALTASTFALMAEKYQKQPHLFSVMNSLYCWGYALVLGIQYLLEPWDSSFYILCALIFVWIFANQLCMMVYEKRMLIREIESSSIN